MEKIELIKRLRKIPEKDLQRYLINKVKSSSGLYLAKLFLQVYGVEEVEAFLMDDIREVISK